MKNNGLKGIVCFLLAAIIAIGAGFYREINDKERVRFSLQIPQKQVKVVTVDLAKQGKIKYYLQPDVLSFYGRGKVTGDNGKLTAKFSGFDSYISQGSKKSIWSELQGDDVVKVKPDGSLTVNVEVRLPKDKIHNYDIGKASLIFFQENKIVSETQFVIINSSYKKI